MSTSDLVIRPAALLPERAARTIMAWLKTSDVSDLGVWSHDVGTIQRYSGPFDGPGGMRGSAQLLGSLNIIWESYSVTIYRAHVTAAGVAAGYTVESLCDEVLAVAGLTLASCPRADLAPAPQSDPFKKR